MANSMTSVAVGWYLYETTSSPYVLGFTGLVQVVPVVGLSFVSGVVVDRFPRRVVATFAHATLAICGALLLLLTQTRAPVSAYFVVLFFQGVGSAFRGPSVSAMVPQLVPPEDFANANAWLASGFELASIIGPAAAGVLIALSGAWLPFACAAVAHLAFVIILLTIPARRSAAAKRAVSIAEFLVGLRFVFHNRIFLGAITLDLFGVLLGGATALLPIYAKDILHAGPEGLGWLRAAPALGALTMAVLQTRLPAWRRPGVALIFTVVGFGAATIVFGLSQWMWLSWGALFFTGVFDNVSVVIRQTVEQSITPDPMRGRVSAVNYVFIGLSNELGAFESGMTAGWFGPVYSVVLGGIGTLIVAAIVSRRFRQLILLPPLRDLRPAELPGNV